MELHIEVKKISRIDNELLMEPDTYVLSVVIEGKFLETEISEISYTSLLKGWWTRQLLDSDGTVYNVVIDQLITKAQ